MTIQISIIVPVFNTGYPLLEAISSLLNQECDITYEIIVVDDQSTDPETLRIEEEIKNSVILVKNNKKGIASARNLGVSIASGEWIAFLDSDDVYMKSSLKDRWLASKIYPSCSWISSDFIVRLKNGEYESEAFFYSREPIKYIVKEAYISGEPMLLTKPYKQFLQMGALTNTNVSMVRKKFIC